MTNAEKYLKDEVSVDKFIDDYLNFSISRTWERGENSFDNITKKFFEARTQPTLTEDERVILRNIDTDFYKGIGRENGTLYLVSTISNNFGGKNDREVFWYCFHELFQFIKEGEEYEIAELLGEEYEIKELLGG